MIVYFANRTMSILGLASTGLREGFSISDDTKYEDIDTGVTQFECTIHWAPESRALAQDCAQAGNYLLRSNNGENEFYTIIEVEEDTKDRTTYIYAEDAGMDLLNETVGEFSADTAHPASWYILMFAEDSGFEIGINEIPSLSRKLEWTGEATVAERIASVATQFDNAEIGYSFAISGLVVTHKYINIYEKRGKDAGVMLRLNREVDRIVTTTSVADLATALYVTGGTPDGEESPITLVGYSATDPDSNGDIYTDGDGLVKSKSALAIWSRYVNPSETGTGEGHIVHQWSYDTTSQSELFTRAVTQLKKVYTPAVNYEVDTTNMPDGVEIGDYVNVVDEEGNLYMQSRVLQMQFSVCNETVSLTLGDYKISSGGLSSQVKSISNQLATVTQKVNSVAAGTYDLSDMFTRDENGFIQVNGNLAMPENYTFFCTWIQPLDNGRLGLGDDVATKEIFIGGEFTADTSIYGQKIWIDSPVVDEEGRGSTTGGEIDIGIQYASKIKIGHWSASSAGMANATIQIDGEEINIGSTSIAPVNIRGELYINGVEYTDSDETLKTSIQAINDARVDNITPVTFKWRDGDNTAHYGYIAQEVREHIPEIVKENADGLLSLAYTEIIPLLHAKINTLEATIDSMAQRIAKLEAIIYGKEESD